MEIEGTCRAHGYHSLIRSAPEVNGWFANITPVHAIPVVVNGVIQVNPDWRTFPAHGPTALEALEQSFAQFKEYINNAVN